MRSVRSARNSDPSESVSHEFNVNSARTTAEGPLSPEGMTVASRETMSGGCVTNNGEGEEGESSPSEHSARGPSKIENLLSRPRGVEESKVNKPPSLESALVAERDPEVSSSRSIDDDIVRRVRCLSDYRQCRWRA